MIITENLGGNAHDSAHWINQWQISRFLIQMIPVSGAQTIAVFRTDCYPDTVRLCEKLGKDAPTVEQWANGELP
jgi:hypothetical protein